MNRSLRLPLVLAAVAAVSAGFIAAVLLRPTAPVALKTVTQLQTPRAMAAVQLIDETGRPTKPEDLRGPWTILFAGFTSCPNICPTTLSLLNRVVEPLGAEAPLRVVLLSVDPERDTPERMKSYLAQFNPRFRGLTGDATELLRLQNSLGLLAVKVPGESDDSYTVDHSSSLVLLNPQGLVAGYISPPFDAAAITGDLQRLLEKKT